MTSHRSVARRLSPIAVLLATILVLHHLGAGPLAPPASLDTTELIRWSQLHGAVGTALSISRIGALLVAYHLLAVTIIAVLSQMVRSASLFRAAERLALPMWRSTLRRIAGVGLSASTLLSAPVITSADDLRGSETIEASGMVIMEPSPENGIVVMHPLDDASTVDAAEAAEPIPTSSTSVGGSTSDLAESTTPSADRIAARHEEESETSSAIIEDEVVAGRRKRAVSDSAPTATAAEASGRGVAPEHRQTRAAVTHVVVPGDHLWALAEHRLASVHGEPPTEARVTAYWRRVIEANPQLEDPDLVFPGDVVELPSID